MASNKDLYYLYLEQDYKITDVEGVWEYIGSTNNFEVYHPVHIATLLFGIDSVRIDKNSNCGEMLMNDSKKAISEIFRENLDHQHISYIYGLYDNEVRINGSKARDSEIEDFENNTIELNTTEIEYNYNKKENKWIFNIVEEGDAYRISKYRPSNNIRDKFFEYSFDSKKTKTEMIVVEYKDDLDICI
jgi:hypothetical protein